MTREDILSMPAGPDLDVLVAEKVMGWSREQTYPDGIIRWKAAPPFCDALGHVWTGDLAGYPWQPSSEIAHAWEVVEHLSSFQYVKVRVEVSFFHGSWVRITAADPTQREDLDPVIRDVTASGAETPEAICRAALLTTMKEVS